MSQSPVPLKWCVVETASGHGAATAGYRIRVWYASGHVGYLQPVFTQRDKLDRYIERFFPQLAGKEFECCQKKSWSSTADSKQTAADSVTSD
jgi:hypothetical protein